MFSGLIEHGGTVVSNEDASGGRTLTIAMPSAAAEGIVPKDSVAVNGVCLTATRVEGDRVSFDVVPETLDRSALGGLRAGDRVNIELSLRVGDRMGGHFVYGHVDATAAVRALDPEGQGYRLVLATPPSVRRYIVEKGYVALDGVSLTVASAGADSFSIAMIPETAVRTTLGARKPGDRVNLEIDPIARYVAGPG